MKNKKTIYILIVFVISLILLYAIIFAMAHSNDKVENDGTNNNNNIGNSNLSSANWRESLKVSGTVTPKGENLEYEFIIEPLNDGIIINELVAEAKIVIKVTKTKNGEDKKSTVILELKNLEKRTDGKYVYKGTYTEDGVTFKEVNIKDGYIEKFFKFRQISGVIATK